jgi:hypothetical protein
MRGWFLSSPNSSLDNYVAVFHLRGDVSEYAVRKTRFAGYVGGALSDFNIESSAYKGGVRESPFNGDEYRRIVHSDGKPDIVKKDFLGRINMRTPILRAEEFHVEDVEFIPKEEY